MSYDNNQPVAQNQGNERELGWDDTINNDGDDFIVLPAAVYPFTIIEFERGRHAGSAKLPPCNKAMLKVKVHGGAKGEVTVSKHQLFLHTKTEGMVCQFFRSIGSRKHGEAMVMDWNSVQGATGFCKLGIRRYQKKDDSEWYEINEIKVFLDPDHKSVVDWLSANAQQQAAPVQQQAPVQQTQQPQQQAMQTQQTQPQAPAGYDPNNPF